MQNVRPRKTQNGFTLVELMIVVAIIGVLAAIAIPQFQIFVAKSKRAEAANVLGGLHTGEMATVAVSDSVLVGNLQTTLLVLGVEVGTLKYYTFQSPSALWGCDDFLGTCPASPSPCGSYAALLAGDLDNDTSQDLVIIHADSAGCPTYFSGAYDTGRPVVVFDDITN